MFMKRLFPLMDADGAGGGGAPTTEPTTTDADGQKAGEVDVQAEAQKIADAMLAKKLKGMPTKEEVAEYKAESEKYKAWKESQQTESEKTAAVQAAAKKKEDELSAKEATLNTKLAALETGFDAKHIDNAVILAMAKATEDMDVATALKAIADDNPQWLSSYKLPDSGGNPAGGNPKKEIEEPPILI